MRFEDQLTVSLDGTWEFYPGDHDIEDLDALEASAIHVPGLWEAQGWLDLDGVAWYRRRFSLDDIAGGWTLRVGAAMDIADVYVNGTMVAGNDLPFTPFEIDVAPVLRVGANEVALRIVDPSLDDPDHLRMPHGKQGWANNVFPSRPSLYMTYGGIWQPVTLRRHGPVVVTGVFANGDPDDLRVNVELENRGPATRCRVGVRTLGLARETNIDVPAGGSARTEAIFGPSTAPRWRPDRPALHDVVVDAWKGESLSDSRTVRYGLRTVRMEGRRLMLNGEPYRMKSALVQGFRADSLYAEGDRAQIREEVQAALDMGLNTLRLHIKAFDPVYLDVCDEMGMLVHCDIPVAEPIAHEEMGGDSLLTRRCVAAARAQVRRDRNHPSIVLWSAMNEICDGRWEARRWPAYEDFARRVAGAVIEEDGTRPVIENDWIEPDPDRVFVSGLLTAHWYGRLHRDYLQKIDDACRRFDSEPKALFVTEYGDWGLPDMPALEEPPFWDTRQIYAAGLAQTLWPASVGRFAVETQRYQGISDRLQTEVFRRHDHIGGYCLTELTDVPHELNGLLDLNRRPKPLAVAEVRRANQPVLPMLRLTSLVVTAGGDLSADLDVANDGPPLSDVTVDVRFGDSAPAQPDEQLLALDATRLPPEQVEMRFRETACQLRLGEIAGYRVSAGGHMDVVAPEVEGSHDLVLCLRSAGQDLSENRYPIHVVAPLKSPPAQMPVRVVGPSHSNRCLEAMEAVGAVTDDDGLTVVAEDGLDAAAAQAVRESLDGGRTVVMLAQRPEAATFWPVPVALEDLITAWGSTMFRFTTDHGALPSLPRRAVLVAEDSTIQAVTAVVSIDGAPFPDTPVVIAYKPVPGAMTATVVGSHGVGAGRLVFCQYRLSDGAVAGDPAAQALLHDLLAWAGRPRPVMSHDPQVKDDGRALTRYSWSQAVAR